MKPGIQTQPARLAGSKYIAGAVENVDFARRRLKARAARKAAKIAKRKSRG